MSERDSKPYTAEQIIEVLQDPKNGILLDARDHVTPGGRFERRERAAFLNEEANALRRHHLSIAGLFRSPAHLDGSADAMGELAEGLLKAGAARSAVLASSTATAKHLMKQVAARLKALKVRSEYHGMYPLQKGRPLPDYAGAPVWIIADVVASGKLCRDLAAEISQCDGKVSGVIALVKTKDSPSAPLTTQLLVDGSPIPFYSVCEVELPLLTPADADSEQIEPVNVDTILRRLIADPRNNMLLDAREHDKLNSPNGPATSPVFELTSGLYQEKFISSWGLFDKPWYFEYCMEHLSQRALKIRSTKGTWFSNIVTCTATGRYLMEHLQARIETKLDSLGVHYLGPFPFHNARARDLDLKGQSVLIVTDVVSRGRMIANILDVVRRQGGIPVAVLSVVGLARNDRELPPCTVEYGDICDGERKSVPIEYLTTYGIPSVDATDQIYPIDPATVLPIERPHDGFRPLIPTREALVQFESAQALTLGFFGSGNRQLTAAIHASRLLERHGDSIWEKIKDCFSEDRLLVSTYGNEDALFHAFVDQRVAGEWKSMDSIFIPRSDSIEFDFPYFLPRSVQARLKGKCVVLLMFSMHSSEKLRKLGALLAQGGVSGIQVICLLNRMGARTVDFVSRIRTMVQGGAEAPSLEFSFRYVYEIRDLHGAQLRRTLETVEWLADNYRQPAKEVAYQSFVEQEITRYFRPSPMIGRAFDERKPTAHSSSLRFDGKEWQSETLDGRIYAICCEIARKRESGSIRDYLGVISEIERFVPNPNMPIPVSVIRTQLYVIYALLFSDVSYLRLSKHFVVLRKTLIDSISKTRQARLDLELSPAEETRESLSQTIKDLVQLETYFLFGLALFCFNDDDREPYRAVILSALTSDRPVKYGAWSHLPLNLEHYCANDRVLWSISLIAFYAGTEGLRERMIGIGQEFRDLAAEGQAAANGDDPMMVKVKYAWDGLLKHLGGHDPLYKHQFIRYLQGVLVEPRKNHIVVVTEPRRALWALGEAADKDEEEFSKRTKIPINTVPETRPMSFADQDPIKRTLDDAIHASAILEGVGEALAKLFAFHSIGPETTRYVASAQSRTGGFRKDADEIRKTFQDIRNKREFNRAQLHQLEKLLQPIESELTTSDSQVLQALKWYLVPLQDKLRSAMTQADVYLEEAGFPRFWHNKFPEADQSDCVLIDPNLLKDVLLNLCTNVRHGVDAEEDPADQVFCSIDSNATVNAPEGEHGILDAVTLVIESPSRNGRIEDQTTLPRQQAEVAQFGGILDWKNDQVARRFRVRLTLLRRERTQLAWLRRFGSPEDRKDKGDKDETRAQGASVG